MGVAAQRLVTPHEPYANPGIAITSTSVVITAINNKPGNVMYWSQAFGTNPWTKELVATG